MGLLSRCSDILIAKEHIRDAKLNRSFRLQHACLRRLVSQTVAVWLRQPVLLNFRGQTPLLLDGAREANFPNFILKREAFKGTWALKVRAVCPVRFTSIDPDSNCIRLALASAGPLDSPSGNGIPRFDTSGWGRLLDQGVLSRDS